MVLQLRGLVASKTKVGKLIVPVHIIRQLERPITLSLILLLECGCPDWTASEHRIVLLWAAVVISDHPNARTYLIELCANLILPRLHLEYTEAICVASGRSNWVEAV